MIPKANFVATYPTIEVACMLVKQTFLMVGTIVDQVYSESSVRECNPLADS